MKIKPIRTKARYRASLKKIESLMSAKLNTPDGDRLKVLTTLDYVTNQAPLDRERLDACIRTSPQ
jgi:HTH-type transcriptional regulator/antitoxin HigA